MKVYTKEGYILSLEEPALASGGEGSVYRIIDHPNKLVKIYNQNEAILREKKIEAMVKYSNDKTFQSSGVLSDISWPLASIYSKEGNFIGFGMNSIGDTLKLDDVYDFPPKANTNISFIEKIKCLLSMCDVITRLHSTNNVFGDFNPENIMINKDMTVGFIDADSFHLTIYGQKYKCIVCAPGYIAPEIIKKTYGMTFEACKEETFTKESDYFGLAVHVFCMLMNGCHPYKCVKHKTQQGSSATIQPIDLRVERGETPFFKSIPNVQTPDWVPKISDFPEYLTNLFKRAFIDGNSNPSLRPNEKEWKTALLKYQGELLQCSKDKTHQYWNGRNECPYCEAIKRSKLVPMLNSKANMYGNDSGLRNNPTEINANAISKNNIYTNRSAVVHRKQNRVFWMVTLSITVCAYLAALIAYSQYDPAGALALLIGAIGGIVGTCVYNSNWSSYIREGFIRTSDYFLSLLCSLGFAIGTLMAGAALFYLFFFLIFIVIIVIAVIFVIGLLSG